MSNGKLKVLITSGGTISKIDDVRNIGNFSEGTTGALIAEEFLRAGATVFYIHSKQAKKPFRKNFSPNYNNSPNKELSKIKESMKEFTKYEKQLTEYPIETFEDYYNTLKEIITTEKIDVAILAAAVSDYSVKKQKGKISSDKDSLVIKLRKNPKVISLIKKWNPKVFQVGFKLLSNASVEELVDTAYKSGINSHSNLTVANTIINEDFSKRKTFLITPEKGITPVSVKELPSKLVEVISRRFSRRHYKTVLEKSEGYFDSFAGKVSTFRKHVKQFYKLNLFEPYFEGSNKQFGFVALRLPEGFLITSRASNKESISEEDIVYVSKVDSKNRKIYVNSSGKKASLNSVVAARIFEERSDINLVLHSHVSLGFKNKTEMSYSPGTQEDVDEIMKYLADESTVELKNHGIIILGENFEDIMKKINIEPAYTRFSKYYDLIYKRFQKSTDFIDLIEKHVRKKDRVLDLAGGTGEVSRQLIKRGYDKISLADKSRKMLEQAKQKLNNMDIYEATFEDLDLKDSYDAIVIRQAINYVSNYQNLIQVFRKIKLKLNKGGKIIFNAPNFHHQKEYPDKSYQYSEGDIDVKVFEKNLLSGKMITHTQRAVLVEQNGKFIKKIYDINNFNLFTKEDFDRALKAVGFRKVSFFGKNLDNYTSKSSSLYCVAS